MGGGVSEAIDVLREKDLEVTGEVLVEINHVLASKNSIDEIDRVRSHPQALSQCREMIEQNDWEQSESSSTAKAAEEIKQNEAAICSKLAARLNGLDILEEGVQDKKSNTTRFLIIGGDKEQGSGKTSLILDPEEDRPGLLGSMLSCFAEQDINLSYIQSRPTRNGLGKYYFYVEAESGGDSDKMSKAVECLKSYAEVKNLGSYRAGGRNV